MLKLAIESLEDVIVECEIKSCIDKVALAKLIDTLNILVELNNEEFDGSIEKF